MTQRLSVFIAILFTFPLLSKINSQCVSEASEFLWANEIGANILNSGDLFWDGNDGKFLAPYSPNGVPVYTIFANALWLGGYDSVGALKVACQQYGNSNGQYDFWPGPIDDSSGEVFENGCDDFDHIWSVNRGEVLQIINDFSDNGVVDLPIPENILKWPARGNSDFESYMGFPLPNQNLALFHDENGNEIYDPINGDYPVLDPATPNVIPDKMTWSVFNDIQDIHAETYGDPLGVEVHQMAYAFNSTDDEVLNRTVFVKYIINKKAEGDLTEFRMGSWMDFDIGCYADDYIGCDTLLNTQYSYNKDNDDNHPNCTTVGTYGENPPVQTATILNHEISSFTYINNAGVNNPLIGTTSPSIDFEFYNYLSSRWKDGTPLTYGDDGYSFTSTNFTPFAFFDNPNEPGGWSEPNVADPNYDQRTVMAIGPYSLANGESITIDMAHTFHRGNGLDHLQNVDYALSNVAALQATYDSGFGMGNLNQFPYCESDCLWPGDADGDGIAKENDLLYLGIASGNGASGAAASPTSSIWAGQMRDDWGLTFFDGIEYKHADFYGDGILDDVDVYTLNQNFGQTTPSYVASDMVPAPISEHELYIDFSKNEVSTTGIPIARLITFTVQLATETNPFQALSGISMVIQYDTSVFEPPLFPNSNLEPNPSFLWTLPQASASQVRYPDGQLAYGITSLDGAVNSSAGKVAEFRLNFREDAATTNPDGMEEITLQILDAYAATAEGEIIPLGFQSDTLLGTDMIVINDTTSVREQHDPTLILNISPNPNNGHFSIFSENNFQNMSLTIFDINGKKSWSGNLPGGQNKMEVNVDENLRSGIYFLKAVREDGGFTTKKIFVK